MSQHGSGHGYPMVVDEHQPGYDWFHQGEGNYLFGGACMADPRMRATSSAPGASPSTSPDRIRRAQLRYRPAPIRWARNGSKAGLLQDEGRTGPIPAITCSTMLAVRITPP